MFLANADTKFMYMNTKSKTLHKQEYSNPKQLNYLVHMLWSTMKLRWEGQKQRPEKSHSQLFSCQENFRLSTFLLTYTFIFLLPFKKEKLY